MALDKPGLKAEIVTILTDRANNTNPDQSPADAINDLAERLANAIDTFVRTGTVNTTGSASAQTGTIT